MQVPTNDFVKFDVALKPDAPKRIGASINGLIYHNQFILNMRKVPDEELIEIKPQKPKPKSKIKFRPPLQVFKSKHSIMNAYDFQNALYKKKMN